MEDIEILWNEDLQCGLEAVHYLFKEKIVFLDLMPQNSTDMNGTIKYCTKLFPDVVRIDVRSKLREPYVYFLDGGEWKVGRYAA